MENTYRILIAEDEPKLGQVIQEELSRQGYQADVAYDGLVAENCLLSILMQLCCLILTCLIRMDWRFAKNSDNRTVKFLLLCLQL